MKQRLSLNQLLNKRYEIKQDEAASYTCHVSKNDGSTLLTVIMCIAFISILGSLMLSVTMTNLEMKVLESKSKTNFYSCETIMDKLRVAVQETASESVKEVYEDEVLVNYASYMAKTEEQRNIDIQKKVIVDFLKKIGAADVSQSDVTILTSAVSGVSMDSSYFFNNAYLNEFERDTITWPLTLKYEFSGESQSIRMQGITVEYVAEDYRTAISSDILVTMPQFLFTSGDEEVQYSMEQPFADYVMLADDKITSDNITGTTNISGNIYAGPNGITINGQNNGNHQVNIDGDTIVTSGDITVSDTAKLNIGILNRLVRPTVLWADNLVTSTSDAYPAGSLLTTDLTINGISLIKDDLVLNAVNSNVNIESGAYIGYTGVHTSEGSAIMINGSGSGLNLSGLSELILAGRAHVSVQDIVLNRDSDILTGESIAFKSNQRAYLIPGQFITGIEHNPITQEDTNLLLGAPTVEIVDSLQMPYNNYVGSTPYKIAAKQTGATILRYYYFNFKNGLSADEFLKKYIAMDPDILNNMSPFSLGLVTLPTGEIHAVGNLMSCDITGVHLNDGLSSSYPDDASLDADIAALTLDNSDYTNTGLEGTTVGSMTDRYSQVSHLLKMDENKAYNEGAGVVSSKIKTGGIDYIINNMAIEPSATDYTDIQRYNTDKTFIGSDPSAKTFWIVDGNVTINPSSTFHGYLIVDGNVTIGQNATFDGFIAAKGNITMEDNVSVTGMVLSTAENGAGTIRIGNNTTGATFSGQVVTTKDIIMGQGYTIAANNTVISDLFDEEGTILNEIFKNAELTVGLTMDQPALVDLTNMISYENWRKTE